MKSSSVTTSNTTAFMAVLLTSLAVLLAAVSAVAGLVVPGLYRDSEGWIRQARAADFVTLLAVVPLMVACLWRGLHGSMRLIALAGLGYLAYTYAIFGFSVAINAMTPVHLAVLGLSVWSVVLNVIVVTRTEALRGIGSHLPRRATSFFLVAVSLLFGTMWLGQIATAIVTGAVSAELDSLGLPTNPVYTLDLAFALPLLSVAGILLLRGWRRAGELTLVAVGWVALMGLGVLAIFAFDAAAGFSIPVAVAGVIAFITVIGAALTVVGVAPERVAGLLISSARRPG